MNIKKEIQDELRELAPDFSQKSKQDGFQAPKHYFDTLPDTLWTKIEDATQKQPEQRLSIVDRWLQQLSFLLQPRPAIALATLAIILAAGYMFYMQQDSSVIASVDDALEQISSEDLIAYISENVEDFDDELLYEIQTEDTGIHTFLDLEEDADIDNTLDEILDEIEITELEDWM